jgi:cytochrome c553
MHACHAAIDSQTTMNASRSCAISTLRQRAGAIMLACLAWSGMALAQDASVEAGRRIYQEGVLSSGASLVGRRPDATVASGAAAACTNCHRPSGMGMVEGDLQVAPITGRFLFPKEDERPLATMDPRYGKRMNLRQEPYTDGSLAAAVRNGAGRMGVPLSPLMPRYTLSDVDMAALTAYLRQLSVVPSPGTQDRTIRFATVITPGVEPHRKKVLLDMLRTVVMQKNGSTVVGNSSRRHMVTAAELVLGTENKWALDIWELSGPSETWGAQLLEYNRIAPPFALLSGISNGTWEPVEQFCESQHIPCWFPSVALPPLRQAQPRYSFYFSRGLALEAEVLQAEVKKAAKGARVVQLFRGDDATATAVKLLAKGLPASIKSTDIDITQWPRDQAAEALRSQLKGLQATDVLVVWLRPDDLRLLEPALSGVSANKYASGSLTSATAVFVPESLRANLHMVYPYQLPQGREGNVAYMHVWLKLRRIPLIDEALQSEVYFGLNLLTDTLAEMLDNLYRDYLIERAEAMITQRETRKAEDQIREQGLVRPRVKRTPMEAGIPQPAFGLGYAEHAAGLREGTTIYPRLSLGPGQRYASKGAFLVRFDMTDPLSGRLVAESDWVVP